MTDSRRYDDDEVREIFERATSLDQPTGSSRGTSSASGASGMTLAEIQEIGAEAGIDPALVARAAAGLDTTGGAVPTIRRMGVPVSVGRIVDLPGRLTDEEWTRLVVRLRDHFNARGTVTHEGSLRSWSNGNLQILMEPTLDGYRLRMRSLSNSIRGRLIAGAITLMATVALVALALLGGGGLSEVLTLVVLGGGPGSALFGSAFFDSRRWTATRDAQFQEIGAMAWEMVSRRLAEADAPESQGQGRIASGDGRSGPGDARFGPGDAMDTGPGAATDAGPGADTDAAPD